METIGQKIGKIDHTFATKNEAGEVVQIKQTFDFTTASDVAIKQWLVSNRVIARQVPLRKLTAQEIRALDGKTIKAETAGHKIVSREEQIKGFEAAGFPRKLALFAVDNPEEFEKVMNKTASDLDK